MAVSCVSPSEIEIKWLCPGYEKLSGQEILLHWEAKPSVEMKNQGISSILSPYIFFSGETLI